MRYGSADGVSLQPLARLHDVPKRPRAADRIVAILMGDDPIHDMMRQIMAPFDEYQPKDSARQGIGYPIAAAEPRGTETRKKLEIDPLHIEGGGRKPPGFSAI